MITTDELNQIISGIEYSKQLLNMINISGVDNYEKILAVYHNLDVIIKILKQEKSNNQKEEGQ